jgi:hypothetical protein
MTQPTRQKTTLLRKEGRTGGHSIILTIPAHVNEIALFEPGQAVCVKCTEAGEITITRVIASRNIRTGKSLSSSEVEALRSCWNRGMDHTDASLEVGVGRTTAWRWFEDFEKGMR